MGDMADYFMEMELMGDFSRTYYVEPPLVPRHLSRAPHEKSKKFNKMEKTFIKNLKRRNRDGITRVLERRVLGTRRGVGERRIGVGLPWWGQC